MLKSGSRLRAIDARETERWTHMPTLDPPPRRSRVEDEVREILERVDRPPTVVEQVRSQAISGQASVKRSLEQRADKRFSWSPRGAIAASLMLAIAALLAHGAVPVLADLLGIAAFAALASLWFVRSSSPPPPSARWRGQDLAGPQASDRWREIRRRLRI